MSVVRPAVEAWSRPEPELCPNGHPWEGDRCENARLPLHHPGFCRASRAKTSPEPHYVNGTRGAEVEPALPGVLCWHLRDGSIGCTTSAILDPGTRVEVFDKVGGSRGARVLVRKLATDRQGRSLWTIRR